MIHPGLDLSVYFDARRLPENPSHHDIHFLDYCVSEYNYNPFAGELLSTGKEDT